MNREHFNRTLLYSSAFWALGAGRSNATAQSEDLSVLFNDAGFDPSGPDSTLIVQVSDLHVDPSENYFATPTFNDDLVEMINGLSFLPEELVLSGDIANSRSISFGLPRYPSHELRAEEEMEAGLLEMQRFDSRMRQWLIPGNHDTDAHEVQPELWMSVLGLPPYRRQDFSGVPVFFMNGRHSGDLDPDQCDWFEQEVSVIPGEQEIVIFVHQPSLNYISTQKGIKEELVHTLAGRSGRVWVFSGHEHRFASRVYIERGTQFIQTIVSTGNSSVFNDGRNPGFCLIGIQDGRVACRVFRDVKLPVFELLPAVHDGEGISFSWLYEDVAFPILTLEEGTYSRDDYLFEVSSMISSQPTDTGTWLSYVKELTWKVPISDYNGKATELLIAGQGTILCEFSSDSIEGSWQSAGIFTALKDVFRIQIPSEYLGVDLYVKVSLYSGTFHFGGWGLEAEESALLPIEQWMSRHFKQIRNVGIASIYACPAGDGVQNLAKYAFGLDPNKKDVRQYEPSMGPSSGGLPISWKVMIDNQNCVGIRFPRRKSDSNPGITYLLKTSVDLDEWKVDDEDVQEYIFSSDGEWDDVVLFKPADSVDRLYFKIDVRLESSLLP